MGFWPPSNRARRLAPDREPQPFWPRPAVLPVPDPSPRPMRFGDLRAPSAGLRLWSPIRSAIFGNLDQMTDLVDHALDLGGVFVLNAVSNPPEAKRSERVSLA